MKFPRDVVKEILDADDTFMVHGTSVEATLAFLSKGRLEKEFFSSYKPAPEESDYLFFMPNPDFFQKTRHSLHERIRKGGLNYFGDALDGGETYALSCAFEHFLAFQLGETPRINYPEYRDFGDHDVARFLQQAKRKGFSETKARVLLRDAGKRKGVLLGIGEKIFDLEILPAKDLKDEVCIHAPHGLDGKYINGIMPLGKIEHRLLDEYFSSQ